MNISIAAILIVILPLAHGQSLTGNVECPCLPADYFEYHDNWDAPVDYETKIGTSIDPKQYGIGCSAHDIDAQICSDANDCTLIVPLPPECNKSFCKRSWCFVDPDNCSRLHNPGSLFKDRHYSYATCGELDQFTYTERLKSLKDRTFQVGYGSNSGGWKGAYNPAGSFAANRQWTGPAVDFVRRAALEGGFYINMTRPPDWLRNNSMEFFGNSNFDLCVYAVSLGYLDFCVGSFSINEKRSSVTTIFEMTSDPVYLITHVEGGGQTDWESFSTAAITIFQPFTPQAWMMIFLFCLPILGLLMLFHEYGAPGSAYPRNESILVENEDSQGRISTEVIQRRIPLYKNICNSLYMGTLSFFGGSYDQSVVSVGGKINLLAIASFIMLILAVYTANLAAILTQDANKTSIDSIEMAVKQGMNFCAERKIAKIAMESYGIDPRKIVSDPIELGGDGQPGFNCPKCKARERVFTNMRQSHSDPSLYCDAAIASEEDLDTLHRYEKHCNKVKVGDPITYRSLGIPIYDKHADALVSLLHKIKTDGVMTSTLKASRPESQCPETGGEGSALNVQQLTGVWVITFSFVLFALLARFVSRPKRHLRCKQVENDSGGKERVLMLYRYDQWGNTPPNTVVVDGYRYDADSDELQEVAVSDNERRPFAQGFNIKGSHYDFDRIEEEEAAKEDNSIVDEGIAVN